MALLRAKESVDPFIFLSKSDLDLTRSQDSIDSLLDLIHPLIVVNCAAIMTEASELDAQSAWEVNAHGPRKLANWCRRNGAKLIQISTDYVFDGCPKQDRPDGNNYTELDELLPINRYGVTKMLGETAAMTANQGRTLVLRAPFRYGPPWPYPSAFSDQWISGRFIDEVAPDIWRAIYSPLLGVLHIPGPRVRVLDLARSVSPEVGEIDRRFAREHHGVTIPQDVSLDGSRWVRWLDANLD